MKLLFVVLFLVVLHESNGRYRGTPRLATNCDDNGPMPFPNPDDCTSFYQCFSSWNGEWLLFEFQCAQGGYFDAISASCVQGECQSHR